MNENSKNIKWLREMAGLTQEELANEIGVDSKTIWRYEKGNNIDREILIKLANYFDVSLDFLLGIDGYINNKKVKEKILEYGSYYKTILNSRTKKNINKNLEYYRIQLDNKGIGGITIWDGFTENGKERRVLRVIEPNSEFDICKSIYGIPMVINNRIELALYYIHKGSAIIEKKLCDESFSNIINGEY